MIEKEIVEQMFREHYGRLVCQARSWLRNADDADDVVQDVFARLLEGDFKVASDKLGAYLTSAVRYGCIKRVKEMRLQEQVKNLHAIDETANHLMGDRLVELERVCDYVDESLGEPDKSVFKLRIEEGMKFREIAERLGMNINTVYKHFVQCLREIKKQFINNGNHYESEQE